MVPLFGAAYAAPNKVTTILYWFRPPKNTLLSPLANGKIQGLFKALECFSRTFQGKFYSQGLFKTALFIQVLFKPVRTLFSLSVLNKMLVISGLEFSKMHVKTANREDLIRLLLQKHSSITGGETQTANPSIPSKISSN